MLAVYIEHLDLRTLKGASGQKSVFSILTREPDNMKKFLRTAVSIVVLAVIVAAVWWGIKQFVSDEKIVQFRTEAVQRGDLSDTISASGTVEPEELVNVGAQVSGKIMSFGTDAAGETVDYGSEVKQGMVLARIDEVLYEAELQEAKAEKLQAEAAILSAAANLQQCKAQMVLADLNWKRAQELFPKGALAKSDYDSAEADYLTCKANIAVAEADQEKAKAQLAISEAALVKAERNLSYCVISSPVDGIIVDRRVSIGQTLVSNMSASSIFLIAKDLKKMQVWVAVNEADIGQIKPGMLVHFNVDAFPDDEFDGVVKKIRLNATMSQNVVTYVVEVTTDNSSGKLLPYLTANVRFVRNEKKDILHISNAALRFMPQRDQVEPAFRDQLDQVKRSGNVRTIWVPGENNLLRPLEIKTGIRTSISTEVLSGLSENDLVVNGATELTAEEASSQGTRNLLMPSGGPRRRGLNNANPNAGRRVTR